MEAYAVFAGGGVKGAAFAGCLHVAKEEGIQFAGYAGASAGSIIALLACLHYKDDGKELPILRQIIMETAMSGFLDDNGSSLKTLLASFTRVVNLTSKIGYLSLPAVLHALLRNKKALSKISGDFALYDTNRLEEFLLEQIHKKIPNLSGKRDITFKDLMDAGLPRLKIMVSDLKQGRPIIYPDKSKFGEDASVIRAICASASYPFVFKPVSVNVNKTENDMDERILVDGGLSCNLPIFAFEKERQKEKLDIIAFKLVSAETTSTETTSTETTSTETTSPSYKINGFCEDMFSTALESSETLLYDFVQGVYVAQVKIPKYIKTLNFNLTDELRNELFIAGVKGTEEVIPKLRDKLQADKIKEEPKEQRAEPVQNFADSAIALQALYVPVHIMNPVLKAVAKEFERETRIQKVRASVSLPIPEKKPLSTSDEDRRRVIVYQYGMDKDRDLSIELRLKAGCSGKAWEYKEPIFADLNGMRKNPKAWGMTEAQANMIRSDRKAVLSAPIFSATRNDKKVEDLERIGVLSIDTSTELEETGWLGMSRLESAIDRLQEWADIISFILKGKD